MRLRPSANALQRAGASRWDAAMSTPGGRRAVSVRDPTLCRRRSQTARGVGRALRIHTRPPSSTATTLCSSANAPQCGGPAQRKVAISATVGGERYPFKIQLYGGAEPHCSRVWITFRAGPAPFVAGHVARLIDERGAMECGGKRADHPFALQPRSPDRAAGTGPMAATLPTETRACT
jgi:hypothetical protein